MANPAAGFVAMTVDDRDGTAENLMAETTTNGTGATRYGGTGIGPPATPPPSLGIDTIAGLIRKLRRRADLSQRELAHAANVSPSTVARAEGRFPAHLDLILDPRFGEWWADLYGLARPPETFHRDRRRRDIRRRRSQREVRGGSVERST